MKVKKYIKELERMYQENKFVERLESLIQEIEDTKAQSSKLQELLQKLDIMDQEKTQYMRAAEKRSGEREKKWKI